MPRWVSFLLFFIPVLVLLAAGHVYLYRRLVRDVTERRGLRRAAQVLFAVGFAGAIGARALGAIPPVGGVANHRHRLPRLDGPRPLPARLHPRGGRAARGGGMARPPQAPAA
ncbi:hypothetical protein ACLESO_57190, partial [Pyxidicoccus sp. 3LG]